MDQETVKIRVVPQCWYCTSPIYGEEKYIRVLEQFKDTHKCLIDDSHVCHNCEGKLIQDYVAIIFIEKNLSIPMHKSQRIPVNKHLVMFVKRSSIDPKWLVMHKFYTYATIKPGHNFDFSEFSHGSFDFQKAKSKILFDERQLTEEVSGQDEVQLRWWETLLSEGWEEGNQEQGDS